MPGFNIGSTQNNQSVPNNAEYRRKYRYIWTTLGAMRGSDVRLYAYKASRPSFQLEEAEVHHIQERAYLAGRTKWESIKLTFYDVEQPADSSKFLWDWISTVTTVNQANVATPTAYKKYDSQLDMINGTGGISETWKLYSSWPQAVNWQELDYTSNDPTSVEVTVRFDRAGREK